MSQRKPESAQGDTLSEEAVADFLQRRPDFFERHGTLLLRLKLPHETSGFTVSLIERQVSMLRQRNTDLERQLKELISVAKLNDALIEKIHQLSVRLLGTSDPAERLEQLETSLREDFGAERAALVLFKGAADELGERPGFVRRIARDDPELRPFTAFLQGGRTRCGPLRDRQKGLLFDREADTIASAAMLPLGPGASVGFLVIGSRDSGHFHPGKRMDFLNRIGELITVALAGEQSLSAAV